MLGGGTRPLDLRIKNGPMQGDTLKFRVWHVLINREEVQIPSLVRHKLDPPRNVRAALHANEKNSAAHSIYTQGRVGMLRGEVLARFMSGHGTQNGRGYGLRGTVHQRGYNSR